MALGKTTTILVFILLIFGLIVISSAGIVDAQKKFGSPYYYFTHQLLYGILPGLLIFYLVKRIDYKIWKKFALPILFGAIALLILVFVPGVGFGLRGARRWIHIGLFSFQPSEVLKPALIIYLAAWFSERFSGTKHSMSSLAPFFAILVFIWAIFIKQPDVGTLGVITLIAFGMYFFSGARMKQIMTLILVVAAVLGVVVFTSPYRLSRINAFINRSGDPQGESYHINQSLIGIGSGGIFGLGFGQSQQKKFNYLPEPVGDSVFSIIGEELGLVGMTFVLLLFLLLTFNLVAIAKATHDNFARLLVLGVSIWIASQAFINIGAISGLIPLTGVPLPFISYGGTALIALLGSLGIVVNIADRG